LKKILVASVLATLAACGGGGGGGGSTAVSQPVQTANRAPVIVDPGTLTVSEGATAVATITASDADNDSLTFSIASGDDQSLFSIDASTGALSFSTAPDFESPGDSGSDNVYGVTVQVSDGVLSDSQSLSITVSDTLAFEETSLVVNVPVDALQSACPGDGVQQQFVLPVDLNGDSLIDFISHYWCQRTDSSVVDTNPTPDLLIAYVSNSDGSYDAANETVFSDANAKLGGASRKVDSGDLNSDGKPDFAFAVNREDLRSVADVSTIAEQPALLLSNAEGYEVVRLGVVDWGHAVRIIDDSVIFAGFNLADTQVFTFANGTFTDVSANGYSRHNAGAFDIYDNFIVQGTSKSVDGKSYVGLELLAADGTALDEFLFEEQFKIQREPDGQNGAAFEERVVYAQEGGELFFDSLANEIEIFESNGEILVSVIYDTYVYTGDGDLVSDQRVEQEQRTSKKEIFLFKIEDSQLVSKNSDIDFSFGSDFVQFLTVGDLNGDSVPDLQFSTKDSTFDDSETVIDGVPRVFLNSSENTFTNVSDEDFIKTSFLENGEGRGFIHDVNGDGLQDFVRFTFNSNIESVKLEVYLATSNFYD
jgi:hypothetical protein